MIDANTDARHIVTQLLLESGNRNTHSDAALAEAEAWQKTPGIDDPALLDLEVLPFVTIDNNGSRDLDQALHVASEGDAYRIHYALADAAYYVRPDSALWQDAIQRGTSLYAPGQAIAMLPVSLSEGLVSLNPGVARRALVFNMLVLNDGTIANTQVVRARIRSRLQLTYEGVQAVADGNASLAEARADNVAAQAVSPGSEENAILDSLQQLKAVGDALQFAQARRGVTPFDRTESEISITGAPGDFDIEPRERLDSERWNEQLSLACNMQGAALLESLEADREALEPVFRVHDAPGRGRLNDLEHTLLHLADALELEAPWRRDRKAEPSIARWFSELPNNAPRLKRAIQRQLLRAQSASRYEGAAGRHHALAADSYARFSSPMREIVGIHTHLVALDALALQADEAAHSSTLRDAVIASAESAKARQKALDRAILFEVIRDLFDEDLALERVPWRTGTLLGLDRNKLHVGLDGTALDIKVYRQDIEAETQQDWTFDDVSASPSDQQDSTRFILGDGVRVQVSGFDTARQRFRFRVQAIGNRPSLRDKRRRSTRGRRKKTVSRVTRARPR